MKLCRGKTVLHLGCSAAPDTIGILERGEHLHVLLAEVCKGLWGIDRGKEGLEVLKSYGLSNLYVGDVEELLKCNISRSFDIVLAAEIIEHLSKPMSMLQGVKKFFERETILCITTPNALAIKFFLHAVFGREMSGPDHVYVFSPMTLRTLLDRAGFKVVNVGTVLDVHSGWRNRLTRIIFSFAFHLWPHYADNIVCLAQVKGYD